MNIQTALGEILQGKDLTMTGMRAVMRDLMSGKMTDAQIGGFLMALRMKGEALDEIVAAAEVMREFAAGVRLEDAHLVDIVGTGGDGAHTFNVSTTASFVLAAAGAKVAKHNNRAVSSRSGSADVLERAGVRLDLAPANVVECVNRVGVGFMFAPNHHPATRHAAGPRKELAVRSIFNLLGPLTNPASVQRQLVGVYQPELLSVFARVLQRLGSAHSIIVCSEDGLDEISHAAPTRMVELKDGQLSQRRITPQQFGIKPGNHADLIVEDAATSLTMMLAALDNHPGAALDIVLLNAGAAIYVAGLAPEIEAGIALARQAIASGAARQKLQELVTLTRQLAA